MNQPLHIPDDGAIFSLLEIGQAQGSLIDVIDALNEMIRRSMLKFPKEVVASVVARHDPDAEANVCIWIKTASKLFDCKIEYNFKRDAQAWAQENGYPDGLDSALGGRESCVVAIISYILKLQASRMPCCVVTDDTGPQPGRAALVEVCKKLEVPTISPAEFVVNQVKPMMNQLAE